MRSYQNTVLDLIEKAATAGKRDIHIVQSAEFANSGVLYVQRISGLKVETITFLTYRFQSEVVYIQFDGVGPGRRGDKRYSWNMSKIDEMDSEISRLLEYVTQRVSA